MRPKSWPRYMVEKRLRSGNVAFYWNPRRADITAGFTLHCEALGQDYGAAIRRANELNRHLDDWRGGRRAVKDLDLQPGFGTLDWLIERYYRSRAFAKVSARAQPEYRWELHTTADVKLKNGDRAGALPLKAISARFVDKLYEKILAGGRGNRVRTANACVTRLKRAWDVVHRLYPQVVPTVNPFAGVERESRNTDTAYVTRSEAYALSAAIAKLGHPTLALAPLVCFEWHQRPEHVLDGVLTWTDYRPEGRPQSVRIAHPKTGAMVWMPLQDKEGLLFPEIEKAIATTPRLGIPMVLTPGTKGKPRPYSHFYARSLIRRARRAAGLPEHVTLKACERGGMTELGNCEVTEAGIMSLSGHKTPQASRLYVKRTETQRLAAARKRRAWVEAERNATKSQNELQYESQNEISKTQ